jgi:V8-like Glu-specific endopeptidase
MLAGWKALKIKTLNNINGGNMKRAETLKAIARGVFKNFAETIEQVENHIEVLKSKTEWPTGEIPELNTIEPGTVSGMPKPPTSDVTKILALGARALVNVERDNELSRYEEDGLEALISLYGRPALLVQDNDFSTPPARWRVLEEYRESIRGILPAVGRIELENHPRYSWIGTGFLAGEDILMTNRHVAVVFVEKHNKKWRFSSGISANVDYREEFQREEEAEFQLIECLGIHSRYDLALFRVAANGSGNRGLPEPLKLSANRPNATNSLRVYAVGYPAMDDRNDLGDMMRIFKGVFDVKRLQPGYITGKTNGAYFKIKHDCSTLGGSSGSPLLDLETGKVIGLHYAGEYLKENSAVPLWNLANDSLLKKFPLNWG